MERVGSPQLKVGCQVGNFRYDADKYKKYPLVTIGITVNKFYSVVVWYWQLMTIDNFKGRDVQPDLNGGCKVDTLSASRVLPWRLCPLLAEVLVSYTIVTILQMLKIMPVGE